MKKQLFYIAAFAAVAAGFSSCKPNLSAEVPSAGKLDFSRYVAVGNSLTAGYADGSLYRTGQLNSYPAMLAAQFKQVGGGDFKIPLLPGESGWPVGAFGFVQYTPKFVLSVGPDCNGVVGLGPVLFGGPYDTSGSAANISAQGPFNNTGVPGIRCIDYLLPGYGSLNAYSSRFFKDLSAAPTAEINRANATFFTAWIGNNDVLAYATSGGAGKGSNGGFADRNSISSASMFQLGLDSVVNRMTAGGAKGVLINIPDVTTIPYFTTIPYNGLVLTRQGQVDSLNLAYSPLGIKFALGQNAFIIADTAAPGKLRQIKSDEYLTLTLPQNLLKCGGYGSKVPIPAQYVLDESEVANIKTATTAFNGMIQAKAAAKGLAYVDINAYLPLFAKGIEYNGVNFTTTFVSGGAFSLDGVHLTPRGYALVANKIISTINSYYGSNVSQVDANSFGGIKFP